jgi:hypothetical protein
MPNPDQFNPTVMTTLQAPLAVECTCPEDCRFDHEND